MRSQTLTVSRCEIVASLSLAADIGMGQPSGQSLRTCLLALGVAREMSLGEQDRQDVFYLSLLRFVGCNAHAEQDGFTATDTQSGHPVQTGGLDLCYEGLWFRYHDCGGSCYNRPTEVEHVLHYSET